MRHVARRECRAMPDMRLLIARGGLLPAATAGACSCAAACVAARMTKSTKPLQEGTEKGMSGCNK